MTLDKNILIGKYLSGNASVEEQKQVEKWRKEDPANEAELEEIKKLWTVSNNLKKEKSYDAAQAWEEFQVLSQSELKIKKFTLHPLKIAAGLALIVSTVLLVRFFLSDSDKDSILVHEQIQILSPAPLASAPSVDSMYAPPAAKAAAKIKREKQLAMTSITSGDSAGIYILPDGSKVYLNKNSRLAYSNNGRTIELEGEAFFEIIPDTLPFYVSCRTIVAKALGTSFNVKCYPGDKEVEVMVLTGRVEVTDKNLESKKLLLSAGELGSYGDDHVFVKSKSGKKSKWWKKGGLKSRIKNFFNKIRGKTN